MPLTKLGTSRFLNLDLVIGVETNVRAQHPEKGRKPAEQYVDDAVKVEFQGTQEPLHLFDDEAAALLAIIDKPAPAEPVKK